MSNIAWRGEQRQRFGIDLDEPAAAGLERRDVVAREQPVRRVVGAERQHVLVGELAPYGNRTLQSSRYRKERPMADYRVEHDSMGEVRVPAGRALGRPDPAGGRELPDLRAADRRARSSARSR